MVAVIRFVKKFLLIFLTFLSIAPQPILAVSLVIDLVFMKLANKGCKSGNGLDIGDAARILSQQSGQRHEMNAKPLLVRAR